MNSTGSTQAFEGMIGVGLRPTHYPYLEERPPLSVRWFEAISENYMDSHGRPLDMLELMRQDYSVALHGVSLSIASGEGIRPEYVQKLKALVERIDPFIVSDHLCWTGAHSANLHDLLPIPFTKETLLYVINNIDYVQNALGRTIHLENVSTYLQIKEAEFAEWDFLTEVANRSGCKILLDINNLYVNSQNHHFDPRLYLDAIPLDKIGQIHLAGYKDMGTYLFDTHSQQVYPAVWDLFSTVIKQLPEVPVLIEWDDDIPDFPRLEQEAATANHYWVEHHG